MDDRMTPDEEIRNADLKLIRDMTGALNFILAFYEPNQRHLDTEAWKVAEARGKQMLAAGKERIGWGK